MTAPAAAPASGPIAPAAPRPAPQPSADRFAFAAVLDSLPGAPAKAGASTTEEQPRRLERIAAGKVLARTDGSSFAAQRQRALGVFAVRLARRLDDGRTPASRGQFAFARLACDERPEIRGQRRIHRRWRQGGDRRATDRRTRLSLWRLHVRGRAREPRARGRTRRSRRAPLPPPTLRRKPSSTAKARLAAGFSPAEAVPATTSRGRRSADCERGGPRRRSLLARARPQQIARASREQPRTKPRAADKSRKSRRLRRSPGSRPRPQLHAPADRAARRPTVGRPIRSRPPRRQRRKQACLARTRRRPSPPGHVPTRRLDGQRRTRRRHARARARSPLAPRPRAPPIREIDVDLSPGGLEDVSMTMRLAGDKLSVVIRAASSQTLNSIEGARDAIADRMAAIGQPLDSLIVKQTGVNTDGNANGNGSSADGGSAGGEQRSAQGAASGAVRTMRLSRRGAGRDRSF